MPVPGLLNVRTVVVPPAAAAAEVLAEPIRLPAVGQADVGMDVDRSRQHQQPGRVQHVVAGRAQVWADRVDPPVDDPTSAAPSRRRTAGPPATTRAVTAPG